MILGVVVLMVTSSVIWMSLIMQQKATYARSFGYVIVMSLVLGVTVFVKRDALLKNKINRNFLFLFAALLAGGFFNRVVSSLLRVPYQHMLFYDLIIFSLVAALGAMMVHPGLWLCFAGDLLGLLRCGNFDQRRILLAMSLGARFIE